MTTHICHNPAFDMFKCRGCYPEAEPIGGFPKSQKTFTLTIEETGDVTMLNTEGSEAFLDLGTVNTQRASHVEPANRVYRVVFHILRWFGDKNRIAEWTRHWKCLWRVNTKPVGGPILTGKHIGRSWDNVALWSDRKQAIEAEIKFLNEWFAVR